MGKWHAGVALLVVLTSCLNENRAGTSTPARPPKALKPLILVANQTDILGYPRYPFGMSGDSLRTAGFGLLPDSLDEKPDPHWKWYSRWTKLDLKNLVIRCESRASTFTDESGQETLQSFLLIGRKEVLFDETGGTASAPEALAATKHWLESQYAPSLLVPSADYATVYRDSSRDLAWVQADDSNVLLQYQTSRFSSKFGEPVCLQSFPVGPGN